MKFTIACNARCLRSGALAWIDPGLGRMGPRPRPYSTNNINDLASARSDLRPVGGCDRNGALGRPASCCAIAVPEIDGPTDNWNMANRVYCTYFDHNYLSRGLALYHSLRRHSPDFTLWVLCQTEQCYRTLLALDLPNLLPVRLEDFEAAHPKGSATRGQRSTIDDYFTCTPAWMLFVLER